MNYLVTLLICLALLNLAGCVTSPPRICYNYNIELIEPTTANNKNNKLEYIYNEYEIRFNFKHESINFKITNKTDNIIKVLWEESAIIKQGKTEKITHKGVKYTDRNNYQHPSIVAPRTTFEDFVVPTSSIWLGQSYYNNALHTEWQIDNLLIGCTPKEIAPTKEVLLNQKIGLLLTTEVNGIKSSTTYNFKINDVKISELNFTPLTWTPVGSN